VAKSVSARREWSIGEEGQRIRISKNKKQKTRLGYSKRISQNRASFSISEGGDFRAFSLGTWGSERGSQYSWLEVLIIPVWCV